jgi:hypothetical protein
MSKKEFDKKVFEITGLPTKPDCRGSLTNSDIF